MLLLELPNGEVSHGIKEAIDPKGKAKLIQFCLQAANIVTAHLGLKIASFKFHFYSFLLLRLFVLRHSSVFCLWRDYVDETHLVDLLKLLCFYDFLKGIAIGTWKN
jgi:hypothetical protein